MVIAAVEQSFPRGQRILDDPFAHKLLPLSGRLAAGLLSGPPLRGMMISRSERDYPGLWAWMACRKRYIDDRITESAGDMQAVVNLGAGFDTRALRLPALRSLPVWEVDQPDNIAAKQARLKAISAPVPRGLTFVPIDFDRQDLAAELTHHGYALDRRTFFVWEGVTQYVAEPGIKAALDFLSRAATGSALAFTYVDKVALSGPHWPGTEQLHARFVKTGVWQFGLEPSAVPALLNGYGWQMIEDLGPAELHARYAAPTHRGLKVSPPIERMVFARKT